MHTPEKVKNPEKWRFYDFDLDVVREEVGKEIAFARNLSRDEFKDQEEFFNLLVEHNKRQEKRPVVGQYDPKSQDTQIEVDFSKAQGRGKDEMQEDLERNMDKEGDVLILDPEKPKKRLPDIIFDRYTGRTTNDEGLQDEFLQKEELIIEPNIDYIKKKKQFLVTDFSKQIGREDLEKKDILAEEYYINVGDEEEKLDKPKKRVIVYDFGKDKGRQEQTDGINKDLLEFLQKDELIIDAELPKKKVKGNVKFFDGPRFPEDAKVPDPFKGDYPPNTEMQIDKDKAVAAISKKGQTIATQKAGMGAAKKREEEKKQHKQDASDFKMKLKSEKEREEKVVAKKKVESREMQAIRNKPTVPRQQKKNQ